jgi:hypothetical protein
MVVDSKPLVKLDWEILNRKDGQADERVRVLHLSRRMKPSDEKTQRFLNKLGTTDGVEAISPAGAYSVQIIIGKCFYVDETVAAIEKVAGEFLSDIVVPKLVT